jgi:hypothetical protein
VIPSEEPVCSNLSRGRGKKASSNECSDFGGVPRARPFGLARINTVLQLSA